MAERPKIWTLGAVAKWATDDFRLRGLPSPRLDAEILVAYALGITRMQVLVDATRPLAPEELARLRELVKRRRSHEPIAYLRGEREFYGLNFRVDRRVLVPRPDTETLVHAALSRTARVALGGRILDLCTGSGCVAITLARQRPTADVYATDLSADALAVARGNAQRLGAYNVAFLEGDLFQPLSVARLPFSPTRFELVVANPPYIPTAECMDLMADVRDFEPRMALDGGPDGLAFYRRIIEEAPAFLARSGVLALEVGHGQADPVAELLRARGFGSIEKSLDLARIERVVSATLD